MIVSIKDILSEVGSGLIPEKPPLGKTFIYKLIDSGEVVYVGQTARLHKRLAEHYFSGKKFFQADFYTVDRDQAGNEEAILIVSIEPKLNKSMPKNDIYISLSSFVEEVREVAIRGNVFFEAHFEGSARGGIACKPKYAEIADVSVAIEMMKDFFGVEQLGEDK